MHITFVKKVLMDGTPCRKCAEVEVRLRKQGYWARLDRVLVADEREPDGEAWQLAAEYGVRVAPFFIVADGTHTEVYTIYLQMVREVFGVAA